MPTLFVSAMNFTTQREELIGGDTSFLLGVLPHLAAESGLSIVITALRYRGTAEVERLHGAELRRIAVSGSDGYDMHDLNALPEPQFLRIARDFGEASFARIAREARPGDACLLNDFFQSGSIARLRGAGLKLVQACHILPSEYVFHEYVGDLFSGERRDLKRRFPLASYAALRLLRRVARTHADLVRVAARLVEPPLSWLVPWVVTYTFARERESMTACDAIVAPTTVMREKILACYPGSDARVHVVPWGVDPPPSRTGVEAAIRSIDEQYGLTLDDRVLVTLSRISPEKGIEFLLDALAQIETRDPALSGKLVLLICGRPSLSRGQGYLAELRRRAAALSRVRVHFPGFVSGAVKDAYLYRADVYVLPSKYESFGLTLLEAMSHETAVLVSDTDGSRDIVDPTFSRMLPFSDPTERAGRLADALVDLMGQDLEAMGKAASTASRRFRWDAVADLLRRVALPNPPSVAAGTEADRTRP